MPVVVAPERLLKSFFSCWGYDWEYELTVDVYSRRIVWLLELDWADRPRQVEQSHAEFLRAGAPRSCAWGAAGTAIEEIDAFVRGLEGARPGG